MDRNTAIFRVMNVIVMVLSLTVHEWAHAFSAFRMGDTTAKDAGRLTLNPLAHIDWVGTILLPLFGAGIGWARPVPFDPRRFRRGISVRTGTMVTKAAGPFSNVLLAFLCIMFQSLLVRANAERAMNGALFILFATAVRMNVGLAVFNAIPIEPLDGAGVLNRFVPDSLRPAWEQFQRIGPMALMALFMLQMMSGSTFGIGRVLGPPITALVDGLYYLAAAIGFG